MPLYESKSSEMKDLTPEQQRAVIFKGAPHNITAFPYEKYYPLPLAKYRMAIEKGQDPATVLNANDKAWMKAIGYPVDGSTQGAIFTKLTGAAFPWENIDYEMHLRMAGSGWPEINEEQKTGLFAQAEVASQVSEAARTKRKASWGMAAAMLAMPTLATMFAAAPGIGITGGTFLAGAATAPLSGSDPLKAGLTAAGGQVINAMGNQAVTQMADFGINPTIGNMAVNAGIAGLTGGDPLQAAISSGVSQLLPMLPGDLGNFFGTNWGKNIIQAFVGTGGGSGFSNFLESLGLRGGQKDVVEEVLAIMALTGLGQILAKDAIQKANELQAIEYDTVKSLAERAKALSDPKMMEMAVQKAQEATRASYEGKQREIQQDLAARGMGEMTPGPTAALKDLQAREELAARRDIEMNYPLRALEAQSAAMGPISNMAQYYTGVAGEEKRLPLDIAMEIYKSRQPSEMDKWLEYQRSLAGQGAGGGGINLNTSGLGLGTGGISTGGLDLTSGYIPTAYGLPTNQSTGWQDTVRTTFPQIPQLGGFNYGGGNGSGVSFDTSGLGVSSGTPSIGMGASSLSMGLPRRGVTLPRLKPQSKKAGNISLY